MVWQFICEPGNEKTAKFITKLLKEEFWKKGWEDFEKNKVDFQTSTSRYAVFIKSENKHNELIGRIKETICRHLIPSSKEPRCEEIKNPSKLKREISKTIPIHPLAKIFQE